jgi:hypothetical protein
MINTKLLGSVVVVGVFSTFFPLMHSPTPKLEPDTLRIQ